MQRRIRDSYYECPPNDSQILIEEVVIELKKFEVSRKRNILRSKGDACLDAVIRYCKHHSALVTLNRARRIRCNLKQVSRIQLALFSSFFSVSQ